MKPRTVMVEVEIRDCTDMLSTIKEAFRYNNLCTSGDVKQVNVSVAQSSTKKLAKKGKVARKNR